MLQAATVALIAVGHLAASLPHPATAVHHLDLWGRNANWCHQIWFPQSVQRCDLEGIVYDMNKYTATIANW